MHHEKNKALDHLNSVLPIVCYASPYITFKYFISFKIAESEEFHLSLPYKHFAC